MVYVSRTKNSLRVGWRMITNLYNTQQKRPTGLFFFGEYNERLFEFKTEQP